MKYWIAAIYLAYGVNASANCDFFSEIPPIGSPVHSARVLINPNACDIQSVHARLFQDGNQIGEKTFLPDQFESGSLVFSISPFFELPKAAGVYRVVWEGRGDALDKLEQQVIVACPAPSLFTASWDDLSGEVAIAYPLGDTCEGQSLVEVVVRDVLDADEVHRSKDHYVSSNGPGQLRLDMGHLEGERRYVGQVKSTNQTGRETVVPFEFTTGCHKLAAETLFSGGVLRGRVEASECQFPIQLEVIASHDSEKEVFRQAAILKAKEFELPVSGYSDWIAGDYTIETKLIGTEARARASSTISVACSAPVLGLPELAVDDLSARVSFSLTERDPCHGELAITAQIRGTEDQVVFNRTVEVDQSLDRFDADWNFQGVPGLRYRIEILAQYGANMSESVTETNEVDYACQAPEVLDVGFSNSNGTHLTSLVAMAGCNQPSAAKMVVRDQQNLTVLTRDLKISQNAQQPLATTGPVSLGFLDDGTYEVEVTVADNKAQVSTLTRSVEKDTVGPGLTFYVGDRAVEAGQVPVVPSIESLSVQFRDSHDPLLPFDSFENTLNGASGSAHFTRIDGENTPQIWFTGYVTLDAEYGDYGFVGVLVRASDNRHWIAPVSRRFVPNEPDDLVDVDRDTRKIGFRAVARIEPIATGTVDVVGVVIRSTDDELRLVEGSRKFSVTSRSTRHHDVVLRQGIEEIPVELSWRDNTIADLRRVSMIRDGAYTLSMVGRDTFGNPSEVTSQVIRVDQHKDRHKYDWPALASFGESFRHNFRLRPGDQKREITVYAKRAQGFGELLVNGVRISGQSTPIVARHDGRGMYNFRLELVDTAVDGTFILQADDSNARPLALEVTTFEPKFYPQRIRTEKTDTLTVRFSEQPCRAVVFDQLERVTSNPGEVICAVRIGAQGTSVLSTTMEQAEIALPMTFPSDALYQEGFIRKIDGVPSFLVTKEIRLLDLQAFSATPQITFVPATQYRNRAADTHHITGLGKVVAGHVVVDAPLGTPLLTIGDHNVPLDERRTQSYRVPVRTNLATPGENKTVTVKAHYPSTPNRVSQQSFELTAVGSPPLVEGVGGQFVSPQALFMDVVIDDSSGLMDMSYEVVESFISSPRGDRLDTSVGTKAGTKGIQASFGSLEPGEHRLHLALTHKNPVLARVLKPLIVQLPFEVFDGKPIQADLFSFKEADKVPFFGQLALDFSNERRRRDVNTVNWERSTDGVSFEPVYCCGHVYDFALTDPGVHHYRAVIENRHSGQMSFTEVLQVRGFTSGQLVVEGPRKTFQGFNVEYRATGMPPGFKTLWRVIRPHTTTALETRAEVLKVQADDIGVYIIEAIADTGDAHPNNVSAMRRFVALEVDWPRIPTSVISGPSKVEFGKPHTYTVQHPPIFEKNGNPAIVREGHWELPDGQIVEDDEWVMFTLKDIPDDDPYVNMYYHSWIRGMDGTMRTTAHRITPIEYDWPDWRLRVMTSSLTPPAILRLSVTPPDWNDWVSLSDAEVATHWDLPDRLRVLYRTPTEVFLYAKDNRSFDVAATVSDSRGNVTKLEKTGVSPIKQIPFEVSLKLDFARSVHTAPIDVVATVEPIVLPKGRDISRVGIYVNGEYTTVTDGSPVRLEINTPGEHVIRAVASIGTEFQSTDSVTFTLEDNMKARCVIEPIGDFKMNGVAKASCDDPDGHMVQYRWYVDGQLLNEGSSRIQLSNSERNGASAVVLVAVDNGGLETQAEFVPGI